MQYAFSSFLGHTKEKPRTEPGRVVYAALLQAMAA